MKTADTTSLPDGVANDRDPFPGQPAEFVASGLSGPLEQERDELAREIAHEVSAGDWVPWPMLARYRSVEQRLDDFAEQMEATK